MMTNNWWQDSFDRSHKEHSVFQWHMWKKGKKDIGLREYSLLKLIRDYRKRFKYREL